MSGFGLAAGVAASIAGRADATFGAGAGSFARAPWEALSPSRGCPLIDASLPPPILPIHIEETIRAIARLQTEHHGAASPQQRAANRVTEMLGQPAFIGILAVILFGWIGANLGAIALGRQPVDPPPFQGLSAAVSLLSIFMVVLILGAQRHEDELAKHRELLTLELAILSEQKTAKVIQLLEEVRRDNPLIHDRVDHEADAMAQPANPQSVLDAIKETHAAEAEKLRAER